MEKAQVETENEQHKGRIQHRHDKRRKGFDTQSRISQGLPKGTPDPSGFNGYYYKGQKQDEEK